MTERPEQIEKLSTEQLLDELARQDEAAADPGLHPGPNADSTLKQLKSELETLASQIREPAPIVPFEDESDCQRVTELVEALGLEPKQLHPAQADSRSPRPEPLGDLGQYRLLAKLGQGGMGTVYKALHTRLDKIVALKVLPEQRMSDTHAVARFEREMRAVGKLEHANIVRALDANEHEGTHYLVMEYVDGIDLSELVRRVGPLSSSDACELARQVAIGLVEAHAHGMVHRDIKPSNVMLARVGRGDQPPVVKILDLGLALLDDKRTDRRELTSTGQMMGTLDYMAPEQGGDSHDVDIRADIYSLGATLYKLLSGESPFPSSKYNTPVKMLTALATAPSPSIATKCEDLPTELVAIVDRLLAKNPEDRFSMPQEVAAALAPLAARADLAALLHNAAAVPAKSAEEQSLAATKEHITAGSHETAPTIDQGEKTLDKDAETADPEIGRGARSDNEHAKGGLADAPQLTSSLRQRESSRLQAVNFPTRWRVALICAAVGFLALAGMFVIRLATDKGEIVIKSYDPRIQVAIKRNGKKVDGFEVSQRPDGTSYYSGEYEIVIDGPHADGVSIKNGKFKLTRGDTVLVEIVREDEQVARLENPKPHVSVPWQLGPAENALPGIVPRPVKLPGVKRWNVETTFPRTRIRSVDYSPDGRRLAIGTESRQVRIIDADSLELINILVGHSDNVRHVAWSPDGNWLATAGRATTVIVWDSNGTQNSEIRLDDSPNRGLAWSQDSKRLAIGQPQQIEVYTIEGQRTQKLLAQDVQAVSWSPDGQWIVAGNWDGQIRLFDVTNGESGPILETEDRVQCIAWNADSSRFATGHSSSAIRLWKTDGSADRELDNTGNNGIHSLSWAPNHKKLVAVSNKVSLHNLNNPEQSVDLPGFGGNTLGVCWRPDGDRFATVDEQRTVRVWSANGQLLQEITGHGGHHDVLVNWSHDGAYLAYYENPKPGIRVWTADGKDKAVIDARAPFAWDPQGNNLLVPARDGRFALRNLDDQSVGVTISSTSDDNQMAWSPDGSRVAFAYNHNDGLIEIRDRNGKQTALLKGHEDALFSDVEWSPGGRRLASSSNDGTVRIWTANGDLEQVIKMQCSGIAWSPTGNLIAAAAGSSFIYNLQGNRVSTLTSNGSDLRIDWSPDGQEIVTGNTWGDVTIKSQEGTRVASIDGHDAGVGAVEWDYTGSRIVSAARDATAMVWNAKTYEPVWVGVQLGTGDSATFSAAGQVIDGDAEVIEEHFVYVVEDKDGSLDLLKPSEFEKRIGQPLTIEPYDTPAQHRALAESVLERGGQVVVSGVDGSVDSLEQLPTGMFEILEVIHVSESGRPDLSDEDFAALADLGSVKGIRLINSKVSDSTMGSLAGIHSLENIRVESSQITDDGVSCLKDLPNLKTVVLGGDNTNNRAEELGDGAAVILSQMPQLEEVDLTRCNLTDAGLLHLSRLANLKRLQVSATEISDRAMESISQLNQLTNLNLEYTRISDVAVSHVANLQSLTELNLNHCRQVTDAGIAELAELSQLTKLQLAGTRLTANGVSSLNGLQELYFLSLSGTEIGDQGIAKLAPRTHLKELRISACGMTDESLKHVARFTSLTRLDIHNNAISDENLQQLAALNHLEDLHLEATQVTAAGVARLTQALPNCRIEWDGGVMEPDASADRRIAETVIRLGGSVEIEGNGDWITEIANLGTDDFHVTGLELGRDASIRSKVALTDADLDAMTQLSKLDNVYLNGPWVTDAVSQHLGRIESVKSVYVNGPKLTNASMKALSQIPRLGELQVTSELIDDEGLAHVGQMRELGAFYFESPLVTDKGISHLQSLPHLRLLHLIRCRNVTDAAIPLLKGQGQIEHWNLGRSKITNKGIQQLLAITQSLKTLTLQHTEITDAALAGIEKHAQLELLVLNHTDVTGEFLETIHKKLPNCRIQWDGGVIEPESKPGSSDAASDSPRHTTAGNLVAEGDAHFDERDLDASQESYNQAIENDPRNSEAYRGRGWVYLNRDEYAKAQRDFDKAIELDEKNGLAYSGRGWVYIHLGNLNQALKDLDRAVALMPGDGYARHSRGVTHYELKKYDEAIEDLSEAIRLDAHYAWSYLYRSKAHQANGDKARAEADRKRALELDPGLAEQLPK